MLGTNSKVNRTLLADQIYESIKSRIISSEYKPSYRLKDKDLADELGVSTIPVREALRLLRAEGFVNIIPHKGAEVVNFNDPEYSKNIYEVRIMIESFAIEKAINNINDKMIKKLKECLEDIKKADKKKGYIKTFVDASFHRAIVEAAGNPYILNIYDSIQFQSPHLKESKKEVVGEGLSDNYEKHKKIFDYFVAKDIEKAKKAIKEHLLIPIREMKFEYKDY
jgi:DNA-binding GntR family transcriptional regulator